MATRHELIHIDFVANAGKANPVLKSLKDACEEARIEKERLDKQFTNAKAAGAAAKDLAVIEDNLRKQTSVWKALEKGVREYAKGIDTLSKGIKEFNQGTLDEMSPKFNKSLENAAKLVQSNFKAGTKEWTQLQTIQEAAHRNVKRAQEDIVALMQSLKDGASISTTQMENALDVLKELKELAVVNSEDWRGLGQQMNQVAEAAKAVANTEKQLKGEITSETDAMRLSNALTKEAINLRHAQGEAAMNASKQERQGIEEANRALKERMVLNSQEQAELKDRIELAESYDKRVKARQEKLNEAERNKKDAQERLDAAEAAIKSYDEQKKKVDELADKKSKLEKQQKKNEKQTKQNAEANDENTKSIRNAEKAISDFDTELENIDKDIQNLNNQPIKPKVDTSEIDLIKRKLEGIRKLKDEEQEKVNKADEYLGGIDNPLKHDSITRARQEDYDEQKKAIATLNAKWDEYWKKQEENAAKFAELLKKPLEEVSYEEFWKNLSGENSELAKSWYRVERRDVYGIDYWAKDSDNYKELTRMRAEKRAGGLSEDRLEELKLLESLKRKWDDYERDLTKANHAFPKYEAEYEKFQKARDEKLQGEGALSVLIQKEKELEEQLAAATGETATATEASNAATEKKVKLTKKEQQELKTLTDDNKNLENTIAELKRQRDALAESQKNGAEAAKQDAEAVREEAQSIQMTAEEAKNALTKLQEKSTFKIKADGTLEASNLEQAQQTLRSIVRGSSQKAGTGWTDEETGRLEIRTSGELKNTVKAFKEYYKLDDEDLAKDIVKKLITGNNGGLFKSGSAMANGGYAFQVDNEKLNERLNLTKELFALSKGQVTDTQALTKATKEQKEELDRLNRVWQDRVKTLERSRETYNGMIGKANSMDGPTEINGVKTKRGEAFDKAEQYRQKHLKDNQAKADAAKQDLDSYKQAILDGTAATTANTKAKEENLNVEQQQAQFDSQINLLEKQKKDNLQRINELQEKATKSTQEKTKATQEETKAEEESLSVEDRKLALEKKRDEILSKKAAKEKELEQLREKMKAAGVDTSVSDDYAQVQSEHEEELAKFVQMKEDKVKTKAGTAKRKAQSDLNKAIDDWNIANNEQIEQVSEAEMKQMKERFKVLTEEIKKDTEAIDENSLAISKLNKQETDAAIEMAQSENVSMEKVKQAIDVLKEKIRTEATDEETMKARGDAINRLTERYTQMNAEVAKLSKPIADKLTGKEKDFKKMSETEIRQAIDAAKELIKTYESGDPVIEELNNKIIQADDYLKKTSIDAMRKAQADKAQLDLMTKRMDSLGSLSNAAFAETKRFWETMYEGAEKNSPELKNIEERLKAINAEEQKRTRTSLEESAGRLGRKDLGTLSSTELKQAIDDAKTLRGTYQETSKEAQALAQMIVKAEEYARTHGVEAVRQAQKEKEAIRQREEQEQQLGEQMRQRLMERKSLSAAALAETKKYWEAQKAGAEEGTLAFKRAEAALKMLNNVEQERNAARNAELAKRIEEPKNFKNYTTVELQESINAAKQLAVTYKSGSDEAIALNKNIAEAEQHIETYSVAAAKAAQKQEEIIKNGKDALDNAVKGEYSTASMQTLEDAIKDLKAYQALIEDPNGLGKETFDATKVQIDELTTQLNNLKGVTEKTNSIFRDADEVLARFGEHMGGMKVENATQQTEKLAQTLDEKLNAATSEFDEKIKDAAADVDDYERQIREAEQELADMEAELERLEKKHSNSSWFRKQTSAYKREGLRIDVLRDRIEGQETPDGISGETFNTGKKSWIEYLKGWKAGAQEDLDYYKKLKAEALGLNEAEEQVAQTEEKVQQTRRMTIEQMQEGIKILENEAMAQDRSTADGRKKWEELRSVIDQMNQELKESTGEWMKLADAEKLAEQAGENYYLDNSKKGFYASPEEIQKATAALNRQRETLIKTIQAKKANGDATEEEEKKLADLTKKLKDLKFEQDNLNMSQEKMRTLMEKPANAVNLEELRAAIKRADGELKRMEGSLGKNSKEYKAFAAEVKQAKNVLKEMEVQSKANATAWEKAFARLKTYVVMYMGFNALWQRATGTFEDMMTLSDKMGEVRKTTGFTADEVGRLSDNLAELDTRTKLTGLMEFSSLAGSVGLKTQEAVQGFSEAANMIAVSLPEMGNEASRTLIKIADATGDLEKNGGDVRETLERVGSTIIALRANSAAAAGPITDFVSRVGAVGAQAGISIDQIAALGATVDALGGRVEMSATALSRMIPAIKNNSFAVAQAIGMTEKELKGKTGMEQMVAIFRALHDSVKGFDTSTEEGMNAMADSVEKALGRSTSMQEVMKQLNQQGARAGIVFGLLSQNVDKLEEQLDTASEAYKKNTALVKEYNKMNETTAAKWERLKNQMEEFFVNDSWQRTLGTIIDLLRYLVDFITGNVGTAMGYFRAALMSLTAAWAVFKLNVGGAMIALRDFGIITKLALGDIGRYIAAKWQAVFALKAEARAAAEARLATMAASRAMMTNVVMAFAAAIGMLLYKLYDLHKAAKKAATELDTLAKAEKRAADESVNERAKLEQLYKVTQDQNRSMEERRKALHDMVGDAKYKEYQEGLLTESNLASTAAKAYSELATQIVKAAKARVYQEEIEKLARENVKLEDAKEEAKQFVDDNKSSYERVSQNVANTPVAAGMFGMTAAAAQTHNDGQRQFLKEYEQKQQDIIDNQEKIKKNNETIGKFEQKLKDTGVKLGGDEGGGNGGAGGGGTNPYGDYNKITDEYSKWNGNDLVARRKEMLERVKALANGADVQAVLSEDAKFISEAVRKNIRTTEQAIEWYNTERLKIQEALYAKHLTNTGDWKDPKKASKRLSNIVKDEMKYYMDELDAYYTERKAKIQEALNDEEISEAEARNRTLANDAEWRQRRAELQQLYAKKAEKVTKGEKDAIYDILSDRTGESIKYIKKDIANTVKFIEAVGKEKGKAVMDRILGDLDKSIEQDFLRQRNAIGQHMKAIQDIIDKERPFNGITKNLQDNLTTMGILTGHMLKEYEELMGKGADMADFNNRQTAERFKELTFLLGESEHAYATTIGEVMKRASDEGLTAWVEYMKQNPKAQEGLMAQLRSTYDAVQDAIKKEASQMKKQAEIMWNNILLPGGDGKTTIKDAFENTISQLGVAQGRVSRANSLIGAGQASERVADKLAIKQMQMQLTMQQHYYNLMRKQGRQRIDDLQRQIELAEKDNDLQKAKQLMLDKQHAEMSLNLAMTKEQTDIMKQQEEIIARTEESEARLYKELREWADLLSSSLQSVFEASNAGNAEYYNELAKLNLTGKGGPGAGTYIVIDNEGTSDAKAHYEYLDEREALERQREIEQKNAQKEAWEKVWDDINQKMNETITDQLNAMLQNQSIDLNTTALGVNTGAIEALTQQLSQGIRINNGGNAPTNGDKKPADNGFASDKQAYYDTLSEDNTPDSGQPLFESTGDFAADRMNYYNQIGDAARNAAQAEIDASNQVKDTIIKNTQQQGQVTKQNNKATVANTQSTFAKMTSAMNLYGIAYQAMSNENLSTEQKFQMIALQATGQAAIAGLTASATASSAKVAAEEGAVASKTFMDLGPIAGPIALAALTAIIGGLMGLAVSKVGKAKSQIAQVTGASVGAGRLATGMLTYAEGNVNEFTDPAALVPGRRYNVDGADGRTYRAKYTGKDARTHITNGPEFHLVGEKGREAIIDAHTTRNIQMNDPEIWRTIQTLYNGGSISRIRSRRGRGIPAFADGNIDDFEEVDSEMGGGSGFGSEQVAAFQSSIDRNNELLERVLEEGIEAFVSPYGKRGIVNGYDTYKKEALRHGEKYT